MGRTRKTNRNLPARMYLKSGSYYFVTTDNKWVKLGKELHEAMRRYSELIAPCQPSMASVAGIINKYLTDRIDLSAKTRVEYERAAKYLEAAFDMDAMAVESHHVWQYLQERSNMGAPVAGNREKALLSAAFSHAIKHGILLNKINPCRGTGFRNKEKPRNRLVSDIELETFLAFCRTLKTGDLTKNAKYTAENPGEIYSGQVLACVMEIAYLTGQRRQSVMALKLQDITDKGVEFWQQKTEVRVLVEWTPRLRAAIDRARNLARPVRSLLLICRHDGQAYSYSGFNAIFQRIMRAWADAGHERFTIHDMRAKAVTTLKDEGRDAKNITGHKTDHAIDTVYDRRRVRRGKAVE